MFLLNLKKVAKKQLFLSFIENILSKLITERYRSYLKHFVIVTSSGIASMV